MEPLSLSALVACEPEATTPLPVQIYRGVLEAIRDGRAPSGARLPSSRAGAEALAVSRNTINTAYDLLRAEGAVEIARGAAPVILGVNAPTSAAASLDRRNRLSLRGERLAFNARARAVVTVNGAMAPGEPDWSLFPREEWARGLRRAARRARREDENYAHFYGLPALHRALAERLALSRGVSVAPEQIIITTGVQSSLTLLSLALADEGDAALVEDPCYAGARAAFACAGAQVAPLPVDAEGADIEAVATRDAKLIYVTPSNQFPLGSRMSLRRRMALLDYARRNGSIILEDDYDSAFHWRGREIPALFALRDGADVIFLGSASKSLAPGLRLGWIVAPPHLFESLRVIQRNFGLLANAHAQLALAELMEDGVYRAHLRRIAKIYGERGRQLAEALTRAFGDDVEINPPDGGVQLTMRFRAGQCEQRCLAALAAAGFSPARLSGYCLEAAHTGLVIGFADADEQKQERFLAALKPAMAL